MQYGAWGLHFCMQGRCRAGLAPLPAHDMRSICPQVKAAAILPLYPSSEPFPCGRRPSALLTAHTPCPQVNRSKQHKSHAAMMPLLTAHTPWPPG